MNESEQLATKVEKLNGLLLNRFETIDKDYKALARAMAAIEKRFNRAHDPYVASPGDSERDRLCAGTAKWFAGYLTKDLELVNAGLEMVGLETKAALQEGTDSEGGFLVPSPMLQEVLRLAAAVAAVRPISRVVPMDSKTLDIPDLATKPVVGWIAEEAAFGQSEPTFGQKQLVAKKVGALAKMSLEVQQDSIVGLGDLLLTLFAEGIAEAEDLEALEGDGTNFVGLLNAAGVGTVAVAAALTNLDPFIDALAALPITARNAPGTSWVMHPLAWRDIEKLKTTTNEYIMNPAPAAGAPLSLLGKPVRLSDQIDATRGVGQDTTAYVGAFPRGMIFGNRMGITLAVNDSVSFTTAQLNVRVMERVAILVAIPAAFVKLTGITVVP